ncbi:MULTISPECIES: LacI family DNA-binding transcriptional regulator [unclassified Butyrivibrio]|uniref:LacI family DNA-binding transcriptional regulator n=1 Tax=unclassified Butyrivibrio TaxID=2639466 RepID=UPI000409EF0B|nr:MULTISPECIES: LacI family DNA-binding transcriptional regulator [unclassified Butyrivibrio]
MSNEKKATVRDIARQAGVSVATVSYVLNDKKGAKISDSTRKKVLQVANMLNYSIPEKYKSGTERKETYSIGVVYALTPESPSRSAEIMQLISLLAERFARMKYKFILIPMEPSADSYEPVSGLDGIIAIDLNEHDFKIMSGNYYVPVLCLDMMINDFLFYQIHTDIETLVKTASEKFGNDFYLITDKYYNEGYLQYLSLAMPKGKFFIYSEMSDKDFKKLENKKVLVLGTFLGLEVKQFISEANLIVISTLDSENTVPPKSLTIHNDINKKANLAVNIMMNALEKKFDVKHEYKVC